MVHRRVNRGPWLVTILSQVNQTYNVATYEIRPTRKLTLAQNAPREPGQESQYNDSLQAGWYGVRIPVGRDFVFSQTRPHRLRVTPSYLLHGHRGPFPRVKRLGCVVDHSPPPNAEVKKTWSQNSTPTICLHGEDRENYTFLQNTS
jgi:hypothetical protein